jgi:hypothetical protein
MTTRRSLIFLVLFFFTVPLRGQDPDHEDFTVEGSVGAWWVRPSGNVLSNGSRADLRADLGMLSRDAHPSVRATLKPSRKNRIVFETIPYKFDGDQSLTRSFTFSNVTYTIQDRISARTDVKYFFGGYQRDFVSSSLAHAGLLAGLAYIDGDANVRSQTRGLAGSETAEIPFPLAGAEFRMFPAAGRYFSLSGELKGLPLGGYGHYFQTIINIGVNMNENLTIQAGYSYLNADVHQRNSGNGFKLDFRGPVISLQFRDR